MLFFFPLLISNHRRFLSYLLDPYTLTIITSSAMGISAKEGGSNPGYIDGSLIRSSSEAMGSLLWFKRNTFLQAMGWNEKKAAEYRKNHITKTINSL